jgi:hypothetical protein
MLVHSGVKAYPCKFCNRDFSRKGEMNRHIKRVHNGVELDDDEEEQDELAVEEELDDDEFEEDETALV